MKFTTAWAEIAAQNVTLKFTVGALCVCCVVLAFTLIKLCLRDPLVLDRGHETIAIQPSDVKQTDAEIRAFVERALIQRYDSNVSAGHFLSESEQTKRNQEQKSLLEKKISQRILVGSVTIEKEKIKVEADKLLSVGNIRSAFLFPMTAQVQRTERTEMNPYGLILSEITPIKAENVEPK
jgi:hypothetical protein